MGSTVVSSTYIELVHVDISGNVYIIGSGNTEEQVLNGQSAAGGRNTFILKYNTSGDLIWPKQIRNIRRISHQI